MKLKHFFAICIVMLLSGSAFSQKDGVGVGIIIGEPTGVSIKNWMTSTTAFDLGIAWSFTDNTDFHLHGDYLWHNFAVFSPKKGHMPFYYGIGARVKFSDKTRFGIRGVAGIAYIFAATPIDLFLEVAPILDLTPGTDFSLNASIGARYYF